MGLKFLVISDTEDEALKLLAELPKTAVREVAFTNKPEQAIQNIQKHSYDIILMGDRLLRGTTYDVALELRKNNKNWGIPVVCMGTHPARKARLEHLLAPYSFCVDMADAANIAVCTGRIVEMAARGH
jgi:CheY-like chemotaxis protein